MSSDGAAVDVAIVDYLRADLELAALLPDGVALDEVPQDSQRFCLVVHATPPADVSTFDGCVFRIVTYQITAVGITTAITPDLMRDAAARIHTLLERCTLPVPGAPPATIARVSRFRDSIVDDDDRSRQWYQRGGMYEVFAANQP